MNTEQKQRIEQIRERVDELKHATLHGPVPLKTTMQIVIDCDELLSIVKGQEAENERLLKLYNSAWLWVQQRVEHPNSGMPPAAMTLMEMQQRKATKFRRYSRELGRLVSAKKSD